MTSPDSGWKQLMDVLAQNNNPKDIEIICNFFLTKEEVEQLNKRVLLTKELINKDKSQREIAKSLKISICTVTRCSNALKECSKKIKEIFGK
ncbi:MULTISPECIES: trp operon repressor [unclassified Francisella]|uniref:trp operon repressor n=1 Tax=unclassified Francisella TaxID=2610885 RepID=UPI002E358B25|nr:MULTISPECIES: trp operon repressor [unclassified Francisella]MED7819997.1 trp operon repressor [Francisella sp. 19S2-4]MED7830818.1 trp operon repressor [Francisella sp. 19S2-10]